MAKLLLKQIKSGIRMPEDQKRTLKALGLRHQRTAVHEDTAAIRGMMFKVRHMITVTPVADAEGTNNG